MHKSENEPRKSLLLRLLEYLERQRPNTDIFSYIGNTETIEKMLFHAELNTGMKEGTFHILHHPTSAWDRTFNLIYHKDKYITEFIELLKISFRIVLKACFITGF